jgi:hypothetical protein
VYSKRSPPPPPIRHCPRVARDAITFRPAVVQRRLEFTVTFVPGMTLRTGDIVTVRALLVNFWVVVISGIHNTSHSPQSVLDP